MKLFLILICQFILIEAGIFDLFGANKVNLDPLNKWGKQSSKAQPVLSDNNSRLSNNILGTSNIKSGRLNHQIGNTKRQQSVASAKLRNQNNDLSKGIQSLGVGFGNLVGTFLGFGLNSVSNVLSLFKLNKLKTRIPFGYIQLKPFGVSLSADQKYFPLFAEIMSGIPWAFDNSGNKYSVVADANGLPVVIKPDGLYAGFALVRGSAHIANTTGTLFKVRYDLSIASRNELLSYPKFVILENYQRKIYLYGKPVEFSFGSISSNPSKYITLSSIVPSYAVMFLGKITAGFNVMIPKTFWMIPFYGIKTDSSGQFYPIYLDYTTSKVYTIDSSNNIYFVYKDQNGIPVVNVNGVFYFGYKQDGDNYIYSTNSDSLTEMKMDPETIKSQIIKLGKSYRGYYSLDPALITSSVVPTSEMVSDLPITVNVIKSEPIEIQSINIIQSPLPNAELTVEASQGQTFNIPDNSVLSSFTHEIIENVKVDADSIERFRDVSIDSTIELPEGFAVVGDMYCMIGNDNVYLPVIIDEQGHAFAINAEQKMFEISFDKNLAPVYIDKNSGQVFGGYKMIAGEKMLSDINGAATDYQKISLDPSLYFDGEMEDSGSDIEIPYGYKLVDDLLVSINNSPLYYPVVTCVESENKMETGKAYVFDDKGQRYDVLFDTNQIPVTQSGGVVSPGLKLNGIDPPTRSLPKGPYESKIFDQF